MKLYGNLNNRLMEGKIFTEDKQIHEGTDITMYLWSDRHCYYVTKVVNQKHIFVKPYYVCADHSKPGGMGHQDWMYFKTLAEQVEYLKQFNPEMNRYEETEPFISNEEEWVFRYNGWWSVDRRYEKPTYHKLHSNVSFGVRDYYYDWEF